MQLLHRDAWPRWARAATSPWLISPLLVVALAIGGVTAYGALTRAHPPHHAPRGGGFGGGSPLPPPAGVMRWGGKACPRRRQPRRAGERARSGEPARSRRWRPARRSGRSRR